MPAQRCPHCGLVNPASAMTCDCGYSFVDGTRSAPRPGIYRPEKQGAQAGVFMTRVVVRVALMLVGTFLILAIRMCGRH